LLKVSSLPWKWYALVFVVLILDQLTKAWATASLDFYQSERVTSFFYYTLRHNYGAAFSFLHDSGGWQRWFLSILAAGVSGVLFVWIAKLKSSQWLETCALALVLGGALGNLVDRVLLGYVVDFIVWHYHEYEWPAFNIADASIFCGAVLYAWDTLFTKKGESSGSEKVKSK